jgi:hypothetical protein
MRITMGPRPNETLAGDCQSLKKAWNCILRGIGPAPDGAHRALDRLVILADRSMLPISIAPLVLQPKFEGGQFLLARVHPTYAAEAALSAPGRDNFGQPRWKYGKDHQAMLQDESRLFWEEPRDRAITPSK